MTQELNEEVKCPKCGNDWNFHFNYDYTERHLPILDVLCNECGEFFEINEKLKDERSIKNL